jgi:hypothetical protein
MRHDLHASNYRHWEWQPVSEIPPLRYPARGFPRARLTPYHTTVRNGASDGPHLQGR